MTRLKFAELTSTSGALVLGVGLGALLGGSIGPMAGPITGAGIAVHAFGMWDKHRLDAQGGVRSPTWIVALYWVCWLLLAALVALLLLRSRGQELP
jgi:MFS family permease